MKSRGQLLCFAIMIVCIYGTETTQNTTIVSAAPLNPDFKLIFGNGAGTASTELPTNATTKLPKDAQTEAPTDAPTDATDAPTCPPQPDTTANIASEDLAEQNRDLLKKLAELQREMEALLQKNKDGKHQNENVEQNKNQQEAVQEAVKKKESEQKAAKQKEAEQEAANKQEAAKKQEAKQEAAKEAANKQKAAEEAAKRKKAEEEAAREQENKTIFDVCYSSVVSAVNVTRTYVHGFLFEPWVNTSVTNEYGQYNFEAAKKINIVGKTAMNTIWDTIGQWVVEMRLNKERILKVNLNERVDGLVFGVTWFVCYRIVSKMVYKIHKTVKMSHSGHHMVGGDSVVEGENNLMRTMDVIEGGPDIVLAAMGYGFGVYVHPLLVLCILPCTSV